MNNLAPDIIPILKEAGLTLKEKFEARHYYGSLRVSEQFQAKDSHELVLEEDFISEEILVSKLKKLYPECSVYSEEMKNWNTQILQDKGFKFLLDPLDGTHNFFYGLPLWGIAVSLLNENNHPIEGFIYLPILDVLVATEEQKTVLYHNEKKCLAATSKRDDLSKSLLTYDNQFYRLGQRAIEVYQKITTAAFTTRITGSAAVDTVMVSLGKTDARLWNKVQPYDIAAGIPLIRGAGGVVCNFSGSEEIDIFSGDVIISGNRKLNASLLEVIN